MQLRHFEASLSNGLLQEAYRFDPVGEYQHLGRHAHAC